MKIEKIWNEAGEEITTAPHPQEILKVQFTQPVKKFDMMRKAVNDE